MKAPTTHLKTETILNKIFLILILTILAGCAAPIPRIANTASGRPEVLLHTSKSAVQIHDAILEAMVSVGFRVDADTISNLAVSIQMSSSEEGANKYVYGGAYGSFRNEVSFTIISTANGVKIFAQPTWSRSVRGDKIQEQKDDNATFNLWQSFLEKLKQWAE